MVYNGHREMSLVVAGRKAPQKKTSPGRPAKYDVPSVNMTFPV